MQRTHVEIQLTAVRISCFNNARRRLWRLLKRLLDKPKQACQGLTADGWWWWWIVLNAILISFVSLCAVANNQHTSIEFNPIHHSTKLTLRFKMHGPHLSTLLSPTALCPGLKEREINRSCPQILEEVYNKCSFASSLVSLNGVVDRQGSNCFVRETRYFRRMLSALNEHLLHKRGVMFYTVTKTYSECMWNLM